MSPVGQAFHSVVAIDDHPLVLESIQALLAGSPYLRLVATAADGAEGLQLIRSARPKLAIIDINLPSLDGLELVRRIRAQRQDIGIVTISARMPTSRNRKRPPSWRQPSCWPRAGISRFRMRRWAPQKAQAWPRSPNGSCA